MLEWLRKSAAASSGSGTRDPRDDFWYTTLGPGTSSGVAVTQQTAMTYATVYACVRLIAETAGQLPFGMFSRASNGDKRPEQDHPLQELLHDQPNDEHTAMEFREMLTAYALMRGTGMAEIVPGRRGAVDQLIPLHPDHIRCVETRDASGRSRWQVEYSEPGAPTRRLLRDELFIVRAFATNKDCPLMGMDPITVQANTMGAALAAQDYAARFFANDARPAAILKHPQHFRDDESRNAFKRAWQAAFGGANRHRTALLEFGMEYQQVSITPEAAQFLETRKLHAEDAARIFRVPPHKIGIMDRATFSNIEQQAIEFVVDTMMPWLIRWEQSVRRDLIVSKGRFFAEHNVAGLLRGDMKTRYEAMAIGRQWGWLSVNDVRRIENMNSIEDGDGYLEPMNMREIGEEPEPPEPARAPAPPPGRNGDRAAGPPLILTPGAKPAGLNGAEHDE